MHTNELQIIQSNLEIENSTNSFIKWHSIHSKQKVDALNIGGNSPLLSMLDILTPEGALSFIIYRVSLIRKLSINFVNRWWGLFFCLFVAVFHGCTSTGRVGLCFLWFYVQELPKAQPAVVLVLKRLRRRGNGLKSHPTDWIRTCDPWFTRHSAYPLHHGGYFDYNGFSLRWIRVIKTNKPKKNHFFRLFCKAFVIGHKMQSLIKKSM